MEKNFETLILELKSNYSNANINVQKNLILTNNIIEKRDVCIHNLITAFSKTLFTKKNFDKNSFFREVENQIYIRFFQNDMKQYFEQIRFLIINHSNEILGFIFLFSPTPSFISIITLKQLRKNENIFEKKFNNSDDSFDAFQKQINRAKETFSKIDDSLIVSKHSMIDAKCRRCIKEGRVFDDVEVFEKQTARGDEGSTMFYICSICGLKWKRYS